MKELTYEDLKPWLTKETKLWTEDDATMRDPDHEGVRQAWERVFGCDHPNETTAVAKTDWGDAGGTIYADGRVSFWACDGGNIYQIPPAGMQALGLAELPYPPHTPPAPPEGMKWEYQGLGWTSEEPEQGYSISPNGEVHPFEKSWVRGHPQYHFFAAVPILEDSSFSWTSPEKKEAWTNALDPKGEAGALKPQLHLIPTVAMREEAKALADGAVKYGPWNWRTNKVCASTYIGAILRHITAYRDGENVDPESKSGVSHLGSVRACCAILLDAAENGTLVDDRPVKPYTEEELARGAPDLMSEVNKSFARGGIREDELVTCGSCGDPINRCSCP